MDFFERVGPVAIGSRARLLSERLTNDARQLNAIYGSELKAKWFPLLYLLKLDGAIGVSELAGRIGQSHPAVVRMVNELVREGLAMRRPDESDGRRTLVQLTDAGERAGSVLSEGTVPDVQQAVTEIVQECDHDLWAALAEWEAALRRRSLLQRTLDVRKQRTAFELRIVPYLPHHQAAWHALNEEWISRYFTLEQADRNALENPQAYIIDRGGAILIAEYRGSTVGTCALVPMNHAGYDYELAKMAVSPKVQGLGIGYEIGKATLELARRMGGKRIYLESNRKLAPALKLYRKLGFEDVAAEPSPYARCDVAMALSL